MSMVFAVELSNYEVEFGIVLNLQLVIGRRQACSCLNCCCWHIERVWIHKSLITETFGVLIEYLPISKQQSLSLGCSCTSAGTCVASIC